MAQAGNSKTVTALLNSTITALEKIINVPYQTQKPLLAANNFQLQYGVFIGITGDLKGKIIFSGQPRLFAYLGQSLFGLPMEGEMLSSFSGELGNMITGSMATSVANAGVLIDITAPTLIQNETELSGHAQAIHMGMDFPESNQLNVYLVLD